MASYLDHISPHIHRVGEGDFSHWASPRRVIYDHELLLIREGECETDIGGERFIQGAGSYLIKPAGIPHSGVQISSGRISFHWIHFDWIFCDGNDEGHSLMCYLPGKVDPSLIRRGPPQVPNGPLSGEIRSPALIFQLFSRINELWNFGTDRERASCRALLLELLIDLLGESANHFEEMKAGNREDQVAEKVRHHINHLLEDPTIRQFSLQTHLSKIGYSYPHLCRVFKKSYGISPLTYLNNQRIERACKLLRDTELPVSEIAQAVGVDNPAYFSRLFSKYTSQSPREYRSRGGK